MEKVRSRKKTHGKNREYTLAHKKKSVCVCVCVCVRVCVCVIIAKNARAETAAAGPQLQRHWKGHCEVLLPRQSGTHT